MTAKKGSLLKLYVGDGETPEVFTVVGGVRQMGWRFGMEPIDTTTADDVDEDGVTYRTSIPGIASGGGPVSGVAKDATTQGWVQDSLQGTQRNYKVEIPNYGYLIAPMFFTDVEFEGPYDGVVGYSANLVLAGAPTTSLTTEEPVNILLPSIVGTAQVGVTLTANYGAWTGGGLVYTYQWQQDAALNGTFANIGGATARTYVPVIGSIGNALRVIVTATNTHSGVAANSAGTAAVIAA